MSVSASPTRVSTGTRKAGYVIAVLVNLALLVGVNVWPGWDAVPFLNGETRLVLSLVNASIAVNLVANAVYVVHGPIRLKALGDLVTLGVGTAALLRIWQVFPFDLAGSGMDWALALRIFLVIGIFGSVIGMMAALGSLVRSAIRT